MFKQDLQCQEVNMHFVESRYIVGSYIVPLVVLPFRQFSSWFNFRWLGARLGILWPLPQKLTFAARKLCLSQPQRRLRRSLAEPVIFSKPDACCGWWTLATANIWGLGPINRGGGCAKIFGAMQYLCSVELNACVHLWLDVYRASLMDMSYLCLYRHFFFYQHIYLVYLHITDMDQLALIDRSCRWQANKKKEMLKILQDAMGENRYDAFGSVYIGMTWNDITNIIVAWWQLNFESEYHHEFRLYRLT